MDIVTANQAYLGAHAIWGNLSNSLLIFAAGFLLVYVGLALPAVWSRRAFRRRAAIEVLKLTLELLRLVLQFLKGDSSSGN